MSDPKQIAQDFLDALATNTVERFSEIFTDDVGLLIGRWDGSEIYRPQPRVVKRLMEESSAWPDPTVEKLNVIAEGNQVLLEFRIQATEHDRYVEHNRSAVLKIKNGQIEQIRLYCPEPMPSTRRKNWIAPADISDQDLAQVFESMRNSGDVYEWFPPDALSRRSLRGGMGGSGLPHPGGNFVGGMRFTDEETDRKIEEVIEHHRRRNIGFQWWVSPSDTPIDLRARLEQHGLVLAGDAVTMALKGLDHLAIPVNDTVSLANMSGYDQAEIDALVKIDIVCFNMDPDQIAANLPGWIERLRDERFRAREANFLAYINGKVAGSGRIVLQGGVAYMGGAGVLPEFRGQKVYSTLLRHRLDWAREHGYHIAAIDAEPLSRPIVERYGFKEYSRLYVYGWMPVIDLDVIKSLVPQ